MMIGTTMTPAAQRGVAFQTEPVEVPSPSSSNNCHLMWFWPLVLTVLLWSITARAASFDCSQAKRPLEQLICGHAGLSALDGLEGYVYYALRDTVPETSKEAAGLLSEQREFLKKRADVCPIPDHSVLSQANTQPHHQLPQGLLHGAYQAASTTPGCFKRPANFLQRGSKGRRKTEA
jgi:hypothetical protein